MRDNLCATIKAGDIIFFGDERFQVFKTNKKVSIERLAVIDTGHGAHTQARDEFLQTCCPEGRAPKVGGKFKHFQYNYGGTFHGFVTVARRHAKTVPILFSGGELPVDKYRDVSLTCFLDGDEDAYKFLHEGSYSIDLTYSVVVPAEVGLEKPCDVKGFTKLDLMAYVIACNGEGKVSRDPLMKKVAWLEGKPWVPTSNSGYFGGGPGNSSGTLTHAAKGKYGRILYGLGTVGKERAAKVLARFGPELGRI